ncbi:hypothetical protein THAOC_12694 [Thalassiosira oceanica]|uniref:Uncharacterized protein n=1 Tax=Thalassiosira oceanica TaxID=159749 RepID=K0T7D8_THAOC|nr:hypothetical protein THAOC_12694 [Thalassiosira oceanica]|eukprot:EJK66392.1 hypothetical protein THAOC_12694 [Thalassiosira oceanica]
MVGQIYCGRALVVEDFQRAETANQTSDTEQINATGLSYATSYSTGGAPTLKALGHLSLGLVVLIVNGLGQRSRKPRSKLLCRGEEASVDERKIFNGPDARSGQTGAPTLKDTYHWYRGQTDSGRGVKRTTWEASVKMSILST